jgi:O-antigen/teichoic acid export membrane protein/Mrp family chromosome partitioning ATPase
MTRGAGPRDPGSVRPAAVRGGADGRRGGPTDADNQILGLARGGGLNLVGAVCNQLAGLGITLLIARELGRAQLGRYAQAYALMALLSLLSLSGLRTGMMRFVAVHRADRDPGAVRGVVRLGIGLTTSASLVLAAALYAAAPWLVRVAFDDPQLVLALRFVAMTLPAMTLTDGALAATQGYRTMKPYALIGLMFEPLARLGLTALVLGRGFGLRGAMSALLLSNGVAAVLAVIALYRLLGAPTTPTRYSLGQLFRFSMVSWVAQLATSGLVWADTILLGLFRSSAEVGVYNVATRLVTLATFVMPAINSSFGPRIADLYHRGQTDSLRRAYAAATSWILRLSLPAFVALVVFPRQLLDVFGHGFRVGAAVTVILVAGKLIDAGTGPCGLMLNMSGRPAWNMVDNITVLVLNVLLNLALIPRYGIVGSAVAWAIALGLVNFARLAQVWWAMRMLPFDAGVLRGFVAGTGALAAGLLARYWVAPPLKLPVGLAAICVCYLLLVVMLGLSAEDRLVLSAMVARLQPGRAARRDRGRVLPGPVGSQTVGLYPQVAEPRPTLQPAPPGRPRLPIRGRRPRMRPRPSPVRYARTLWRGAPAVLAGTVIGLLAGVVLLPSLLPTQPTYRATVTLDIRPFTADVVLPGRNQGGWTREELVQSTLDLDLAAKVVRGLGPKAARLRATRGAPPTAWPSRLLARLEARPSPSSDRQVELSYVDPSAKLAAVVVNGYAKRYVLARRAIDQNRTATALKLLDRQAAELRTGLAEWAQRVDQERSADGTVSTITQTELDLFKRRYDAKLAELQRLRDQALLGSPITEVQLPPVVRVASKPPDRQLVAAVAALLGLAAAAALMLLAEAAAPRVGTAGDAEAATGADLAVTVPRLPGGRRMVMPAAESDAFGPQAEAYRRLAGTLERRGLGTEAFVLAVTSADPGEGRSTVAINLAHSLARNGHSVLLVSSDLGRPSIERAYGLSEEDIPGLGEHLAGLSDHEVVFLLVMLRENLFLLPAGRPVGNPAELLAGPRLERLLAELRSFEWIVVLDTPPARWAAESLSLAAAADATLLVAHANRSRWRAVADLAASLRRDRVPVLGVAVLGRRQRRLAGLARRAAHRWTARAPAVEPVPLSRSGEWRGRARSGR